MRNSLWALKVNFRAVLLSGLVLLGLEGCATLTNDENFTTSVINVRPATATLLETGLELTLRLTNETASAVTFEGSSHKLFLNGSAVGRAVSNESHTVPALSTSTFSVTVYLANLTLLRKFQDYQNIKAVSYRLESKLHSGARRTVATVAEGSLDVSQFSAGLTPLAAPLN